jgi:iron(III) transport system permease protein
VAVPGVVLGIGYLRTFVEFNVPIVYKPLASWWVIIVIALAIRRLPYALRACVVGLQQVSVMLEQAAENLGATKYRTVRRIVVPSSESDAPLAFGIYQFMQSAAGRGPGAALGIIAVLIVGIATYISHRVIERSEKQRTAAAVVAEVG